MGLAGLLGLGLGLLELGFKVAELGFGRGNLLGEEVHAVVAGGCVCVHCDGGVGVVFIDG